MASMPARGSRLRNIVAIINIISVSVLYLGAVTDPNGKSLILTRGE